MGIIARVFTGAAAAALLAGAADAASATFNFGASSNGSWVNELTYSAPGLTLSVTGQDIYGRFSEVQTWAGHGLGVYSFRDDSHQIDSAGRDDIAVLSFSRPVTIRSLAFSYVDGTDSFNFLVDAGSGLMKIFTDKVAPNYALAGDQTAQRFGVGATVTTLLSCSLLYATQCSTSYYESAFKLWAVTVDYDEPSPVPLPAAGFMALAGLGALGALRRVRRR